ncbi:MAG: rhomboid family intramembrane serine protease [Hyphomicrobiaceae bacterium]|nr:MAG: rhomboid family intramembrane serine protease [Hyphomicrobiaceae bacterium]
MVFIPLSDDNPLRAIRFQWVTVGLIAVNIVVFIWQSVSVGPSAAASFAVIPAELLQVRLFGGAAHGPYDLIALPEGYTLLSYMFLHGDIFHLASNMIFLWVFGDNVEDAMGHLKFLVFYVLCGIAAGLTHTLMLPDSKLPLIGASGAVAGVIAAYLILHPRVLVWVLAFRIIPLRISAAWVLGVWVVTQIVMVVVNQADQVAWWAHIGGMITGAILIVFMRRPGVQLFDRWLSPV